MDARGLLALTIGQERHGYIEIRYAPEPGGNLWQEFIPTAEIDRAARFIAAKAQRGDVFMGAAPRLIREGGKHAVPRAWTLWVDCDTPESVEALATFRPLPTAVIRSGTGSNVHAWWKLDAPAPARYLEQANRRLAHRLGADPRCAEVARIMRPPGTLNYKHDPPAKVEYVAGSGVTRSLLMAADLEDPPQRKPGSAGMPRRIRNADDPLRGISSREYIPRLTGRSVDHRGFVQCIAHEDWNPSLMAYEDPKRGWYCFQCGEGGDIYSFGALFFDLRTDQDFRQIKGLLERELL